MQTALNEKIFAFTYRSETLLELASTRHAPDTVVDYVKSELSRITSRIERIDKQIVNQMVTGEVALDTDVHSTSAGEMLSHLKTVNDIVAHVETLSKRMRDVISEGHSEFLGSPVDVERYSTSLATCFAYLTHLSVQVSTAERLRADVDAAKALLGTLDPHTSPAVTASLAEFTSLEAEFTQRLESIKSFQAQVALLRQDLSKLTFSVKLVSKGVAASIHEIAAIVLPGNATALQA